MLRIYKQGEPFYPFFDEPSSSVSSVDMLIIRDDGYFLDFDDSTFKDAAWTTKEQALTEKTEGVWIWSTGWTIPLANRTYHIIFKDDLGNVYAGPDIQVGASPSSIRKNTALANFSFPMIDTNGDPATGLTVTAERLIDGTAYAACDNSVTEISDGSYKINLSADDLNGDVVMLKFTATGARATTVTIITES